MGMEPDWTRADPYENRLPNGVCGNDDVTYKGHT